MTSTADIYSNPDARRWDEKYSKSSEVRSIVEPEGEPELVAHEKALSAQGMALEIACGKGKNAMYLAQAGYDVIAADIAIKGLAQCLTVVHNRSLSLYPMVCDISRYPFPVNTFDLVSVVRYLDRALLPKITNWVKPGGYLFYKTFNKDFLNIKPNFNPAYLVMPGELNEIFSEFDMLDSDYGTQGGGSKLSTGVSFILARKPKL